MDVINPNTLHIIVLHIKIETSPIKSALCTHSRYPHTYHLPSNPKFITGKYIPPHHRFLGGDEEEGCLGALDGTYIDVHIPSFDKPRFRTRKGHISTNILSVCDREMRFVYVLPGWE
ncbi:hypothetical protein ACS0TY_032774 [Phlomoides rotata]